MACGTLETIAIECANSAGGIDKVYFMDFDSLGSTTVASGVITAWTPTSSATFVEYAVRPETASAEQVTTIDDKTGTNFKTQTLNVQLSKVTAAKSQQLEVLAQKRILAIYLDENGLYKLYGYDKGMTVTTINEATGVELGNLNGYNVTLVGREQTSALEVDSSLISSLT